MVKYNKRLQTYINISIINYIHFKGTYIKYGPNGKIKEYNYIDNLIFEGKLLNGKRIGRGKEYFYYTERLKFQGNYLNNERNGKGKEYFEDGILKYEGDYLNGERNGNGKEYYNNAKLKFEGIYLYGKELIGTKYDKNGNILCKCNVIGKGKVYSNEYNKLIFEGE